MKQLTILLATFLLIGVAYSQTYYFATPQGYGAATTGGGTPTSSNTVTVSNYTAFKNALTGSKSVIIVSGVITIPSGGRIDAVVTNKTILGLPGAKLVTDDNTQDGSGILQLKSGSTNVIIRNLIFEGPNAYDVDGWDLLTNKGCNKLWVDHCEFRDGLDDCFDNTSGSDNITISWCKFVHLKPAIPRNVSGFSNDHRYSNLVGGGDTDKPSDGSYSITWQNCWWSDGNKDRMARGRNVQFHILNCYWTSQVASNNVSLTSGDRGCTAYIEGSIFNCTGKPVVLDIPRNSNGTPKTPIPAVPFNVKLVDTYMSNGTSVPTITMTNGATNPATLTAPNYSYTVFPSSQVVAAVTKANCGAGATLNVTAAGVISTSCSTVTGVEESDVTESVAIFPNPFQNDFVIQAKGDFEYTIMDMAGIKMMEGVGKDKAEVGGALKSGLYLLHLKQGLKTTVLKVDKK